MKNKKITLVLLTILALIGLIFFTYKYQTDIKPFKNLISDLKREDPETFHYPGCAFLHGPDGNIEQWSKLPREKRIASLKLFQSAKSQNRLIYLDYNPTKRNTPSDEVWIMACTCQEFQQFSTAITANKLNYFSLVWHTNREDPTQRQLDECLGDLHFT